MSQALPVAGEMACLVVLCLSSLWFIPLECRQNHSPVHAGQTLNWLFPSSVHDSSLAVVTSVHPCVGMCYVLFMTKWLHCTKLSLLAPVGDVLGEEACPGVPCCHCLGGCRILSWLGRDLILESRGRGLLGQCQKSPFFCVKGSSVCQNPADPDGMCWHCPAESPR